MAHQQTRLPFPGDYVWYDAGSSGEFDVPIGAKVKTVTEEWLAFLTEDNEDMSIPISEIHRLKPMNDSNVDGVEDMIHLDDASEAGLLRNIRIRFGKDRIYTYTGTILVALNPNKNLGIYNKETIHRYARAKLGEQPPHIFATANAAYVKMKNTQANQCIINSGETGAGKTESTKLILQFLAAVSGQHSWIEQQILDSNPVLEAFGNAKTSRNDNSSRFGKYINIHFDRAGHIKYARIQQYLLERCRIVQQNCKELNYHIFYLMLSGLQEAERARLHLQDVSAYKYLVQGGTPPLPQHSSYEFRKVKAAMKVLMFTEDEIWTVFSVLAALLHLGNVHFKAAEVKRLEASEVVDTNLVRLAADLLQLDEKELVKWLTSKSTSTGRGDTVVSPLSVTKALDMRDSLVKAVYGKMFIWVAARINGSIEGPKQAAEVSQQRSRQRRHHAADTLSIGILDIFGFEHSDHGNFFEQLCVNYTNEKLQNFFLHHIFKLEQAEYEAEDITWSHIPFVDNQDVLDLLCMRKMNILALVDEESKFPRGSDSSLLQKLTATHSKNPLYIKPKPQSNKFGIQHFAGTVSYITEGFLDKNRDTFSKDLIRLLHASRLELVHGLFKKDFDEMGFKVPPTLATQFRSSLDEMMEALHGSEPFFVRCVKPNMMMKPTVFERQLVLKQLRYSGMMETVKIRMVGYPVRMAFSNFVKRYWMLFSKDRNGACPDANRLSMKQILSRVKTLNGRDWQVGRSKVFLKEAQHESLETERGNVVFHMACKIQRGVLRWLTRVRLKRRREATVVFQRAWRTIQQRRWFLKVRSGFVRMQALWRCHRQRRAYCMVRAAIVSFQPYARGFLVRRKVSMMMLSLIKLQSHARRLSAMRRVGKLRLDLELAKEAQSRQDMEMREAAEAAERTRLEESRRQEEEEKINNLRLQMAAEEEERLAQERAVEEEVREEALLLERKKEEKRFLAEKRQADLERAQEEARQMQEMDSEEFWADSVQRQREEVAGKWRDERERVEELQTRQRSTSAGKKSFGLSSPVVKIKRVVSNLALRASPAPGRSKTEGVPGDDSRKDQSFFDEDAFVPPPLESLLLPWSQTLALPGKEQGETKTVTGEQEVKPPEFGILPYTAMKANEKPLMTAPTNLSSFGFRKFAAVHFRDEMKTSFSGQPSQSALLYHSSVEKRQMASQLRVCVMQFMGDLSDTHTATRAQLIEEVGQILSKLRHHQQRQETMPLPAYPLSQLDKVHFIVGTCILYPSLRDEVFSVILQQLSGNPNPSSRALGWVLLCLCLGCCAPSVRMINYLRSFILTGPKSYAPVLEKRLHRTYSSTGRQWPPSFLELQAAKIGTPQFPLIVRLADGRSMTVMVDPATTAGELCCEVTAGLKLNDTLGFSLAVEMGEKVVDIGASDYPVLDAVCACEQYTSQVKGCDVTTLAANERHQLSSAGHAKSANHALNMCSLVLQRRFFPPWHDSAVDPGCTELVYHQVVRSIKTAAHQYQSDEELVVLLAQECFVRFGGQEVNTKKLIQALMDILPDAELQRRPVRKWAALVKATQAKGGLDLANSSEDEIKRDVVDYAKETWCSVFSYRYSVERVAGFKADFSKGLLFISVHYGGMSLMQDVKQEPPVTDDSAGESAKLVHSPAILLHIPYHQIASATTSSTSKDNLGAMQLVTMDGDRLLLTSPKAVAMCMLVNEMLKELRQRSHFAVVLQTPYSEDEQWMPVQFGDLLVLDDTYGSIQTRDVDFVAAVNLRTGETGDIPTTCLSVLPVSREPEREFKVQLANLNAVAHQHLPVMATVYESVSSTGVKTANASSSLSSASTGGKVSSTSARAAPSSHQSSSSLYSLKSYASRFFAPAGQGVQSIVHPSVWQHTRGELKKPLLFNLRTDPLLLRKAINMFTSILKYCGEYPTQVDQKSPLITERVFKSPLTHPELRDELYCQLFKQLTGNPCQTSTDRAWQLLWLATGLFACSKEFVEEAKIFLRSRSLLNAAASKCLHRLQTSTRGSPRRHCPHRLELLSAQSGFAEVHQTVFFPDQSSKKFPVSSRTKVRNLLDDVCKYFGVHREEFDLVLEDSYQVMSSLPEKQFMLDVLRDESSDEIGEVRLVFVRKLWVDDRIGVNKQLDHRVNFPQELAKYMQGCHKVSNSQAVYLAVLVWYLKYSHTPGSLDEPGFSSIFHHLVPEDMIRCMSLKEWRKSINDECKRIHGDASVSWAERKFLERLSSAPTFGATFFSMKQTVYSTMPLDVLMAVNKYGVALLDATKKDVVARWDYEEISMWTFGQEHFHLTIGGVLRHSSGLKLLCDTKEGGMIDMLLTAYTNQLARRSSGTRKRDRSASSSSVASAVSTSTAVRGKVRAAGSSSSHTKLS